MTLDADLDRLRQTWRDGTSRSLEWRATQLEALKLLLEENDEDIVSALEQDLGRPAFEGWLADVGVPLKEVDYALKHLAAWAAPRRVKPPVTLAAAKTRILPEPKGVVLIIGPWNYPVHLLVIPMAAALAAGNTVVLKPSELAPATSSLLARLIPKYFDSGAVLVVEGGVEETTELLTKRFDHICYTGNGTVGRIVAAAAAKHLTPLTLELGGKSPTIVDKTANLEVAAKRIAWTKFTNAGQTCVAPDYVLAHQDIHDRLVDALVDATRQQRGSDPRTSEDFGRIINQRHTERIKGLIDGGGFQTLACGGTADVENRYIDPTILVGVAHDAPVMQEEIFGPVLPIIKVTDLDAAVSFVNAGEKPLALYIFGDAEAAEDILARTSSGGACINDAVTHLLAPNLPFGGVGESGYGAYHGRSGFEEFSHRKSVLDRPSWFEIPTMYPPYSRLKSLLTRKLL